MARSQSHLEEENTKFGCALGRSVYLPLRYKHKNKSNVEEIDDQQSHSSLKQEQREAKVGPHMQKLERLELVYKKEAGGTHPALLNDDLHQYSQELALKHEPETLRSFFNTDVQSQEKDNTDLLAPLYHSGDDCLVREELVGLGEIKVEEEPTLAETTLKASFTHDQSVNHALPDEVPHSEGPYTCDSCGNMFASSMTLNKHTQSCKGSEHFRPYGCTVCGRRFTKRGLAKHKATHSGQHSYACDVCGKQFYLKGHLNKHQKLHKHPLFVSGHLFASEEEVLKYSRSRTGRDPHRCSVCGRFFLYRIHLTKHHGTHRDEYLIVCEKGGEGFSCSKSLEDHLQNHA